MMADQNFIPPNLPMEEKKSGPVPTAGFVPPPTTSSSRLIDRPNTPTATSPPPPRPVKTYIRTMDSDINAVKSGQAPRGVEKPLPAISEVSPPAPNISASIPSPKPAPVVEIKLSKPEQKTVSLPSSSKEEVKITINAPKPAPQIVIPPVPAVPKLIPPPTFSRPEPHPVSTPPTPPRPVLPPSPLAGGSKPAESKPLAKPAIVPSPKDVSIPAASLKSFMSPKMFIPGVILLLLVAAGVGYWFFILRGGHEGVDTVVSPSPSKTAVSSVQPPPRASQLSSFFSTRHLLPIKKGEGQNLTSVLPEIERLSLIDPREHILLDPRSEGGEDYSFSGFLNRFLIDFPANMLSAVDEKTFDLIWSAQKEKFVNGKKTSYGSNEEEHRLALAVRVTNAEQARKMMLGWEATLPQDLQNLFTLPVFSEQSSFSPASHRNIAVRYMNFPTPDYSIDYAVVTAKNNDDYLVISNSREQMFSIINVLLGF